MSSRLPVILPERLQKLPPYLFAELDRLKQEAAKKGMDVINLGVGDPDLPSPSFVIDELCKASKLVGNHHYPPYSGTPEFRKTITEWFSQRFQVELNPDQEVLVTIGSKDSIAHLPLALINPGDTVVVPDPGYPVYAVATNFIGGKVVTFPLKKENNFFPDLKELEGIFKEHHPTLMFLNYPNNPTAATATLDLFAQVAELAKRYKVFVCHDNAYSELYYDGKPSPSFLQVPGGKDVCIEMHSLSKTFNMTGWRVGFAVGHADLVAALAKVKTNIDSGVFMAVQSAGMVALRDGAEFMKTQRQVFQERRDQLAAILKESGFRFQVPAATFYLWVEVPKGMTAMQFCQRSIQETGVVITPGTGMGAHGEGFFRVTITAPKERLIEAGKRLQKLL